jgi:ribosomal protein S18 acetylase RimI-like enzyme
MHPLDNPIWQALTTSQAHLARIGSSARRFPNDITSLGAFPEPSEECYRSLASILEDDEATGVLFDYPAEPPEGWTVLGGAPLLEMVHKNGSSGLPSNSRNLEPVIRELTVAKAPEMVALAQLTKPGPFGLRTRELGGYIGIHENGRLVAMAGERLHVPGFTEISAVCTHPDFLGRGYAAALMTALMKNIYGRGEVPFLHVREDNLRAIALYERLGFEKRVLLHYRVLRRPGA